MTLRHGRTIGFVQPGQQVSAARENQATRLLRDVVSRMPESEDQADEADASGRTLTELSRVTEKVRIYQDNDPTSANYVDVQRTLSLRLRDSQSGEIWTMLFN